MSSRCSSDAPSMRINRSDEPAAGSAPAFCRRRLVHFERFTELPYINPACEKIQDMLAVSEKVRKHVEDKTPKS